MGKSGVFILGTIAGVIAVSLWRREIKGYVGEQTHGMRTRAADGMRAVDEKTGQVLDSGGKSLRRAEGFLRHTKEHVSGALLAGQKAIRPPPKTRAGRD
jgi:hypothetical protein